MTIEEKRKKHAEYMRGYLARNAEKINADRRKRMACPERKARRKEVYRKWAKSHPDGQKTPKRIAWLRNNADGRRAYLRAYMKDYRIILKSDPVHILTQRLRYRLKKVLKYTGTKKTLSAIRLVGCSSSELLAHIQSTFKPGMTWENRRMWHVDHIKPCAAFDLTDVEQQKQCFHYTNLQALWAEENMSKGKKFNTKA